MLTTAEYMDQALFHAERGRGRTNPNPLVGAVVVSPDGVVVGEGCHERIGEAHAEVNALEMAGDRARGSTLYCTLEPCSHYGRTGPCVERIVQAGVARVFAAAKDPNPLVSGKGFAFLREHGVEVEVGLHASRAAALNQPFLTWIQERRPFVILKAAISLDGCIAEAPGRRTLLTSAAANRHVQLLRAEVDAIGVGIGTVLTDDPALTARGAYRERPLVRVVFDRMLRTPVAARVLSTPEAGPVIIVTSPEGAGKTEARRALEQCQADILVVPDGSMRSALTCLGERQIASLLLEGGARLHEAAWMEGQVDSVRLYVTPHVLGRSGVRFLNGRAFSSAGLIDRRVQPMGPDVLIEGYVHGPR